MADYHERRRLIRESLKIQPLSHGQVYTYTVGVRSQPEISPERYEELRWSLENHSSNLIPIVVRRTDSLGGEKEYEAIYGADWVRVAEDIGIEMLWAWVFDLSDEDVKATQAELAMLLDHSLDHSVDTTPLSIPETIPEAIPETEHPREPVLPRPDAIAQPADSVAELTSERLAQLLGSLLDQKLDQTLARLSSLVGAGDGSGGTIALLENKLDHLERRLNHLTDAISNLTHSLESLKQQTAASRSAKKTIDLDELAARLKQFRQDPSSVPADQLKADLNQRQVTINHLLDVAEKLGITGSNKKKLNKKMKKHELIECLLAL